jgi:hypothetical protein
VPVPTLTCVPLGPVSVLVLWDGQGGVRNRRPGRTYAPGPSDDGDDGRSWVTTLAGYSSGGGGGRDREVRLLVIEFSAMADESGPWRRATAGSVVEIRALGMAALVS